MEKKKKANNLMIQALASLNTYNRTRERIQFRALLDQMEQFKKEFNLDENFRNKKGNPL